MKIIIKHNKEYDFNVVTIESDINLDLGNNYTMDHYCNALFDALPESEPLIDEIEKHDLNDEIEIICNGNYGLVGLYSCGNDISDYFRPLNKIYY